MLTGPEVYAFGVDPLSINLETRPGAELNGEIKVHESGKDKIRALIYEMDYDNIREGSTRYFETGTVDRSCAGWVTLSHTQVELSAENPTFLKYTVNVPEDATGTYWMAIMVEGMRPPEKPEKKEDQDTISVKIESVVRFAIKMTVNVKQDIAKNAEVGLLEMKNSPDTQGGKPNELILTARTLVRNQGNTRLTPRGYFELKDMDGNSVYKIETDDKYYVLPGREQFLKTPVRAEIRPGEYVALTVLDYGGESLIAGETRFSYPLPEPGVESISK